MTEDSGPPRGELVRAPNEVANGMADLPVQIAYRNTERSKALDALVGEEAGKLPRFFQRIVNCRVLIEHEHRHHRKGTPVHVRIELGVPGEELVINSSADPETVLSDDGKDAQRAIRDAFRKAERRLADYAKRKAGEVKAHSTPPEPAT